MTVLENRKIFVFCDFDGTITAEESLEAVFLHFLPGQWEPVKQKLIENQTTLRKAVPSVVESIPSEKCREIIDFVSRIPLRPGFEAFLDFLDENNIPLVIVSGGIRKMVETKLSSFLNRFYDVIAVDVDARGKFLRVHSRYEGGDELVDKASVMKRYDADIKIVIGDGITDFNMARHADLVFARDALARHMRSNNFFHMEWIDFTDVKHQLRQWLLEPEVREPGVRL
jgi:2-hydroxy-3-keto-5-methylthiopentenyl-1-phosphate phosphatase